MTLQNPSNIHQIQVSDTRQIDCPSVSGLSSVTESRNSLGGESVKNGGENCKNNLIIPAVKSSDSSIYVSDKMTEMVIHLFIFVIDV